MDLPIDPTLLEEDTAMRSDSESDVTGSDEAYVQDDDDDEQVEDDGSEAEGVADDSDIEAPAPRRDKVKGKAVETPYDEFKCVQSVELLTERLTRAPTAACSQSTSTTMLTMSEPLSRVLLTLGWKRTWPSSKTTTASQTPPP